MRSPRGVDSSTEEGISPVVGAILMVAITIVLAAAIFLSMSGFMSSPEFSGAGVTVESTTPGEVTVQLVDRGTADRVIVRCGDTQEFQLDSIGSTVDIVGPACEQLTVLGVTGDREQVIQRPKISVSPPTPPVLDSESGVSADIIVAKDGSGDVTNLGDAIEVADDGETVLLKNVGDGRYDGSVTVYNAITITAEPGVVLTVPLTETLDIRGSGVTLESLAVEGETGGWGAPAITVTEEATITNVGISSNEGPGIEVSDATGPVILETVTLTNTKGVGISDSMDVRVEDVSIAGAGTALSVSNSTAKVTESSLEGDFIGVVSSEDNDLVIEHSYLAGGNRSTYITATHTGTTTVSDSVLETDSDEVLKVGFYSTFSSSWEAAEGTVTVRDSEFVSNGVPVANVSFEGDTVDLRENWWGSTAGPQSGDIVGPDSDVVDTDVWCTNVSCTSKSS